VTTVNQQLDSQVSSSQEREEHGKRCFRFYNYLDDNQKICTSWQGDDLQAPNAFRIHGQVTRQNYMAGQDTRMYVRPFFCVLVYCKLLYVKPII